jgi:hypothetical protein
MRIGAADSVGFALEKCNYSAYEIQLATATEEQQHSRNLNASL